MSAWIVVPCLDVLRDEFDAVAPGRDKGADGGIGDSAHTSSSDHTPDEDSDVLRDHDADSKNEIHARDIDSSGPWPDGKGAVVGGWFDTKIRAIAERERQDYESPTIIGRLQYIIWNHKIISRSWGWSEWRAYTGADPHTNHAHFSARYVTEAEYSTRPWGVKEDDVSKQDVIDAFRTDGVVTAPSNAASVKDNPTWAPASALTDIAFGWREIKAQTNAISAIGSAVAAIASRQGVDTAALLAAINNVDEAVVTSLVGQSDADLAAALVAALGSERAAAVGALLSGK